jgi:hypothetical protein
MSTAISERGRQMWRLVAAIPVFAASYLLALGIQQTVTLLTAKQLGGYAVTIGIGRGPVTTRFTARGRPVEVRRQWWRGPDVAWEKGLTPRRSLTAGLAGIGVNLVLACLGALDLRHRESRGLRITVAAHLAAIATAALWALFP